VLRYKCFLQMKHVVFSTEVQFLAEKQGLEFVKFYYLYGQLYAKLLIMSLIIPYLFSFKIFINSS